MVFSCLCCCQSSEKSLFCLHQKDKSSESKVEFRQASNHCKGVLEAVKLPYSNKTKETITSKNLALRTFGKMLILFSAKVNLLYLFFSTTQRCCLLHLIKQNCLLKTFLRTLILMTLYRPVNEWCAIALACAHTCQYLFRHAAVACAKLYMTSYKFCFSFPSVLITNSLIMPF